MILSVVIPVYNVEGYLGESLASMAGQTLKDWEAICVDDGSSDCSGEILDAWQAKDSRFKVIHQPNQGVSAARNKALEIAKGEWIGFLDGDDSIAPTWFEQMMRHAAANVDIIHTDSRFCFEGRGSSSGDHTYREFLRDGWSFLNLVRRSAIGSLRFPEGMRFKEDMIFFSRLAFNTPRIAWVRERGYNYRLRSGSAIASPITAADCARFHEEIARLPLPERDKAKAIGFDLVLWVKGRDRTLQYDPERCPVRQLWQSGIASGTLFPSDLRFWWRPALKYWLATGSLRFFDLTLSIRTNLETFFLRSK